MLLQNVTGDATVTCLVAQGEGEINRDSFNDSQAGIITEVELPHKVRWLFPQDLSTGE